MYGPPPVGSIMPIRYEWFVFRRRVTCRVDVAVSRADPSRREDFDLPSVSAYGPDRVSRHRTLLGHFLPCACVHVRAGRRSVSARHLSAVSMEEEGEKESRRSLCLCCVRARDGEGGASCARTLMFCGCERVVGRLGVCVLCCGYACRGGHRASLRACCWMGAGVFMRVCNGTREKRDGWPVFGAAASWPRIRAIR